jgi:hypothetical protein
MVYNIDPLSTEYGVLKEGSQFDNRLTAGLRMGHMKLLTGDPRVGGHYPPVSTEGKHLDRVILFRRYILKSLVSPSCR